MNFNAMKMSKTNVLMIYIVLIIYLWGVGVLFSPLVSGWAGGQREKVCPGCTSETIRYRKLIFGRDIGLGV